VLGNVAPELVLIRPGTSSGLVDLERRLDDGKSGTAVLFHDLTLLDLELTSLDETRTYRDDLPRNPVVAGTRVLELPDGSRVVRYLDEARKKSGLLRVHDGGRLEVVFEGELCEVKCCILASKTHLAFATDSHRLYLYRLDETNWPGSAEPILDITPPANEIDFLDSSLVFGERVLAFVDEHRGLFLAPLDGSVPFAPVLPPSGGRAPEFFDSEVAVSGDGHTFAFGAGRDRELKDVYVVRDDGVAVNITKKPTIYADVGYSNPGRRVELALNHDGSLVSWVDRTIKDDANYVSPVEFPVPVLITGDPMFKCIDIGTTSRFPPKGGLLIVAGQGNAMLDLFFSPLMKKEDVVPLTKTASSNVPPYASDSKLDLFDIATYRGGDQYMTWAHHEQGFDGLWVVDTVHEDARLVAKSHAGFGMSSADARTLVIDDGNAFVVFDPKSRSSSFATRVALGNTKVTAAAPARDRTAMFAIAGTRELWAFDVASQKSEQLVKDADLRDLSPSATSNACFVLTGGNGGVELQIAKRGTGVTRLATGAWTAFLR
ncbi:MAG: hypothetical protein KDC95_22280, partial [Planctomycetes bacterium]|nr:hypothetical protein [Planctomycetota bacterium]